MLTGACEPGYTKALAAANNATEIVATRVEFLGNSASADAPENEMSSRQASSDRQYDRKSDIRARP
jgi:hypothetical protein